MGRPPLAPELRKPRISGPSGRPARALDGGAEARALLLPLATAAHQVVNGEPTPNAWAAVARMLGLKDWERGELGKFWRGERQLTPTWRERLKDSTPVAGSSDVEKK
jgi:hypothetical protein